MVAALWIAFSDAVASRLAGDLIELATWQMIKGFAYVTVTSVLLFGLLRRRERALTTANERLRATIDATPVPMAIVGPDRRVMAWSPAAEEAYGWRERDLKGEPLPFPEQDGGTAVDVLLRHVLAGHPVKAATVRLRAMDGRAHHAQVWGAPLPGAPASALLLLPDLTEARVMREEIEAARRRLESAERLSALGSVIAGVAHEIRNPLTALRMHAELLGNSIAQLREGRDREEGLAQAERSHRHLAGLLDRLEHVATRTLALGKSTAGERRAVDLNAVASEVLEIASASMPVDVKVTRHLHATRRAWASEPEISQVVLNLLLNAGEALTAVGGGTITVRTQDVDERVLLEVTDSGPGIPPEAREVIFTPFWTTKTAGTGLGLAISRRVAEAHGGRLVVESAPGEGTTFRMELPTAAGGA